jgi:hypothetical protein
VFVFCRPLRARAMTHRTCSMRQGFQGALKEEKKSEVLSSAFKGKNTCRKLFTKRIEGGGKLKQVQGCFFRVPASSRGPEALRGPCSRNWCPLRYQWPIGSSHSHEGAVRVCLNGVLAKCGRRAIRHLQAAKKVRSYVRWFLVFFTCRP